MSREKKVLFLQGNEACAEGAIAAGVNFFAGYPITPSTEIAEVLSKRLPENGGVFIQMEDELASMGAVVGASLAGAKAMLATSGPGFTLIQENLGYAAMVEAPCVIVNVQRGGPSSGIPTMPSQSDVMQARWGNNGDKAIIALAPSSVSEMFFLTIQCVNYAEKYRVPTILLADAVIGHMREKVAIPGYETIERVIRKKPMSEQKDYLPYRGEESGVPLMASLGDGYRHYITGCVHDETGKVVLQDPTIAATLIRRLHEKIENNVTDIVQYEADIEDDTEILVVAYGSVARSAKEAIGAARKMGLKAGLFRPITIWPFAEEPFLEAIKNVRVVIVPEMNRGQYFVEISRAIASLKNFVKVVSLPELGSVLISPDSILKEIRKEAETCQK